MSFLDLLEPPAGLDDHVGSCLPEVIPDWVLAQVPLSGLVEPRCDCCGGSVLSAGHALRPVPVQVAWAIPGVTGLGGCPALLPPVSADICALQDLVRFVSSGDPTTQSPGQALADTQALLTVVRELRVLEVRRLADVSVRELPAAVGYRSTAAWLRVHRPDGDGGDAKLGRALRDLPALSDAVSARGPLAGTGDPAGQSVADPAADPNLPPAGDRAGDPEGVAGVRDRAVSLAAARKVVAALRRCRPHVDRPDGLIDGQPGDLVIEAVVRNVLDLVCREHGGFLEGDSLLAELTAGVERILVTGRSDLTRLEGAFTLLAQHVPVRSLTHRLEELVLAVVPSLLEDKARDGADRARLSLDRKSDGSGWTVVGELDLECGERLFTALRAEAARDPRNPRDTAEAERLRSAGVDPWNPDDPWGHDALLPGREVIGPLGQEGPELVLPRDRRRRLHDALNRLLGRYLEHGLGGTAGKVPVQINVTLSAGTVTNKPGALPATGDSGTILPRSLVRRWWCDSRITGYVLSRGLKALGTVHLGRTVTARERQALHIETGSRCVGLGCCRGEPDPLIVLRPHHVYAYALHGRTCLAETLAICDTLHRDLHDGHKTVRLRDGRYLNENGWIDRNDLTPWG